MSDAELNRRRKLQGKIGRTTATLGLTGAALGVGALAAKKPGALKAVEKVPGLNRATHEGLKEGALYTGIAAGGIGGVGGFNQASIYSAESRKRKQAVQVKKDFGMEMGYYGEEGHPLTHEELEAEIEKAWTPSASNFDSERDRKKRSDHYSTAALVTGGAGAAYGGHHGFQAIKHGRKVKSEHMAPTYLKPAKAAVAPTPRVPGKKAVARVPAVKKTATSPRIPPVAAKKAVPPIPATPGKAAKPARMAADVKRAGKAIRSEEHLMPALKHGGKAGLGAGVAAGAIGVGMHLKRKKKSDWQPYSKRDDGIEKKLSRKEKGAVAGAAGGVFGPVGSATASGVLAPKGKKIKHTAIGAGAGLAGPLGGAASGYYAAGATKKKKVSKRDTESAFGVEHGEVSKLFGKKRKRPEADRERERPGRQRADGDAGQVREGQGLQGLGPRCGQQAVPRGRCRRAGRDEAGRVHGTGPTSIELRLRSAPCTGQEGREGSGQALRGQR